MAEKEPHASDDWKLHIKKAAKISFQINCFNVK